MGAMVRGPGPGETNTSVGLRPGGPRYALAAMSEPPVGPVVDERGPAERPVRWGLGDAVGGYLGAFVLMNLAATMWYGVTREQDPSLASLVVTLAALWAGLVGTAVVASRLKGRGSLREDYGLRIEARDLVLGLVVGVASQLLLTVLYLPFRLLAPDLDPSEEAERLLDPVKGPGLVLLTACLVVGAPLVEELFFRGLLQRALARRFGARWAVAGSALAFGLTHYQPVQLLGLVAFGVVLGLMAVRTGRLGPGVVAHAAFNATTVVILVLLR